MTGTSNCRAWSSSPGSRNESCLAANPRFPHGSPGLVDVVDPVADIEEVTINQPHKRNAVAVCSTRVIFFPQRNQRLVADQNKYSQILISCSGIPKPFWRIIGVTYEVWSEPRKLSKTWGHMPGGSPYFR
jgi:hypothetical protein